MNSLSRAVACRSGHFTAILFARPSITRTVSLGMDREAGQQLLMACAKVASHQAARKPRFWHPTEMLKRLHLGCSGLIPFCLCLSCSRQVSGGIPPVRYLGAWERAGDAAMMR
jgi:hypothetical protein